MTKLEQHDLQKAFPMEPIPDSSELTDSVGDDVEDDISILRGRRWDALQPHEFRPHFEVVCWLTPLAFRYYLPAIINCSLIELNSKGKLSDCELVVDYTLRMLTKSRLEDVEISNESIWKVFSADQMDMVRRWISELAKYPDTLPASSETLNRAINTRMNKS